MLNGMSDTIN